MKKKISIGIILLLSFFIGSLFNKETNTEAASKKTLEEMVYEQQTLITNLRAELNESKDRIENLENKEKSTEGINTRLKSLENSVGDWQNKNGENDNITDTLLKLNERVGTNGNNINLLKRLNRIDEDSIKAEVANLKNLFYGNFNDQRGSVGSNNKVENPTNFAGSTYYNIFDYLTEQEIKEAAKTAISEVEKDYDVDFTGKVTLNIQTPTEIRVLELTLD
ncbi:hypothetical protein ABE288_05835 [Bacillus salipaludis]|uniref:hypothetical protein n=1 Tax=Bacillus salipaludis TaxID=2547811 RepID=UPI003D24C208